MRGSEAVAHGTQMRGHLCGIQTAWTDAFDALGAVAAVAGAVDRSVVGHLIVFFSPAYDAEILTAALAAQFPGVGLTGCSTSGGISPAGSIDRGLVAIAFPRQGFRIVSGLLTDIARLDVEGGGLDRARPAPDPRRRAAGRRQRPPLRPVADRLARQCGGDGGLGGGLGARRHPADRRLGRRRPRLPQHGADPRGPSLPRGGGDPSGRDRFPDPDLQERQFRADQPQVRGHRRPRGRAARHRTQRRARGARICHGSGARPGKPLDDELCRLPARGEDRRGILLPLDQPGGAGRLDDLLLRHRRGRGADAGAAPRHRRGDAGRTRKPRRVARRARPRDRFRLRVSPARCREPAGAPPHRRPVPSLRRGRLRDLRRAVPLDAPEPDFYRHRHWPG
ncbi:protein of unknown function [Methylorubrum extorquens]|uniref:FIST domain-containing protein n=1 Tax=Methylorubrum extorquens TaxID=408 RepID=A0A2N9ATN3_METEX|nr:protein of unknown function [Methylorubrum extorquens]